MAEHLICLFFLWVMAMSFLLVAFFIANLRDFVHIPRGYNFPQRVGAASGNAIHQVMINNNGWFLIFITMSLLSLIIWIGVQFQKPSLTDQVKVETTGLYERQPAAQKFRNWLMDGQWRTSTPKELHHDENAVRLYKQQMNRWPWLMCSIIMLIVAFFSIFVVLRDEAARVWARMRHIHFHGRSESIALSESFFAGMLDRLAHRPTPVPAAPLTTTQPQTPASTTQPARAQETGFRIGTFLIAEFVWEMLEEVFRNLVHRGQHT